MNYDRKKQKAIQGGIDLEVKEAQQQIDEDQKGFSETVGKALDSATPDAKISKPPKTLFVPVTPDLFSRNTDKGYRLTARPPRAATGNACERYFRRHRQRKKLPATGARSMPPKSPPFAFDHPRAGTKGGFKGCVQQTH